MNNLKKEKSCGCVIIENDKVLLIKQIQGSWGFPKGHMEVGETEVETAIRKVKEETNLDVEINENKRYTLKYVTDRNTYKEVVFFLAKKTSENEKYQESEITAMEWMNFDDAMKTITYDKTRKLFSKILKEENL